MLKFTRISSGTVPKGPTYSQSGRFLPRKSTERLTRAYPRLACRPLKSDAMATNNLKTVLEQENLKPGQLVFPAHVSKATIMKVFNLKRTVAPSTEEKLVNAVNKLTKKGYALTDVFPGRAK